jgi:hypothetical protein
MNKSQYQRARATIQALIQGIDPETGIELPAATVVNKIDVNRALTTAVAALDAVQARLLRRAQLPESVGKTLTADEEATLQQEFQGGIPIADIAKEHGRTIRAIEARLERLGLLSAAERTTINSFTETGRRPLRYVPGGKSGNGSDDQKPRGEGLQEDDARHCTCTRWGSHVAC